MGKRPAHPECQTFKTPLPEAFAKHFVIGIRDIPLISDSRAMPANAESRRYGSGFARKLSRPDSDDSTASKRTLDDLKMMTSLTPRGRESAQPEVVQQMTSGGTYFLFGFSKMFLDFGKKDHEVEFSRRSSVS